MPATTCQNCQLQSAFKPEFPAVSQTKLFIYIYIYEFDCKPRSINFELSCLTWLLPVSAAGQSSLNMVATHNRLNRHWSHLKEGKCLEQSGNRTMEAACSANWEEKQSYPAVGCILFVHQGSHFIPVPGGTVTTGCPLDFLNLLYLWYLWAAGLGIGSGTLAASSMRSWHEHTHQCQHSGRLRQVADPDATSPGGNKHHSGYSEFNQVRNQKQNRELLRYQTWLGW